MTPSDPIRSRLALYAPTSPEDEEDALKEIVQEILLFGLSEAGFFERAAFVGGTSLRIAHGLPRFSEDLAFSLHTPDPEFRWSGWDSAITRTCERFGMAPHTTDRSKADSIGMLLDLSFVHPPGKKLRVKLEVDCNPPAGALCERRYQDFPVAFPIEVWTLSSNFAGKLHAALCRRHVRGRDWFDFNWYVQRRVAPNLELLGNALDQHGPWSGQGVDVTMAWLTRQLQAKVESIEWDRARVDVRRFLRQPHLDAIRHWERDLFLASIDRLAALA